jgi:hypothetical protein
MLKWLQVPRVVNLAGESDTVIGWVLSDEPPMEALPRMEQLRQRFHEADPGRFCLVVSMWPQTPHVPEKTNLPVVCVDLYPFFGPDDPNGPPTDQASQAFFRMNAHRMVEAIGEKNVVPWVMGMCFSEIWGPRKYDARWHLVGRPGSYLHWRCPSLAEMRWQVWETLRSRCKGIIIYTLAPEPPDPKTENLPPPDVTWTNVLTGSATDLGPNALTNPDCTPTPQLEELGSVYQRIASHKELIRQWKATALLAAEVTPPARRRWSILSTVKRSRSQMTLPKGTDMEPSHCVQGKGLFLNSQQMKGDSYVEMDLRTNGYPAVISSFRGRREQ